MINIDLTENELMHLIEWHREERRRAERNDEWAEAEEHERRTNALRRMQVTVSEVSK